MVRINAAVLALMLSPHNLGIHNIIHKTKKYISYHSATKGGLCHSQSTCAEDLVKFDHVVYEICKQTNK